MTVVTLDKTVVTHDKSCSGRNANLPVEVKAFAKKWQIPETALTGARCEQVVISGQNVLFYSHAEDDSIPRFVEEVVETDSYHLSRANSLYAPFILDIGTNLGVFSIMAHLNNPTATIVSIEPNPMSYVFFIWNLSANKLPVFNEVHSASVGGQKIRNQGIIPIHSAATADGRPVTLEYSLAKGQNAITSASSRDGVLPEYTFEDLQEQPDRVRLEVPSVNIKSYLAKQDVQHVSFLKIDCEGCEYEVFPTITATINKNTFLAGELHACKPGHTCSYPEEVLTSTKKLLCDTFDECCLNPYKRLELSRTMICGGMPFRRGYGYADSSVQTLLLGPPIVYQWQGAFLGIACAVLIAFVVVLRIRKGRKLNKG